MFGGYAPTRAGRSLQDALVVDEELRAAMSEYTDRWQTMTKGEIDDVLVGLLPGALERNDARIAGYYAEMRSLRQPEVEE